MKTLKVMHDYWKLILEQLARPSVSRIDIMQNEEKVRAVLNELIRVQLECCTPVYFVPSEPLATDFEKVRNGTMTFAKVGQSIFGISCAHVYRDYQRMERDTGASAWIKNTRFNPEKLLIHIDDKEDIALFRFETSMLRENEIRPTETVISPFKKQEKGERILMTGFPGAWKRPCPANPSRLIWKPFHALLLSEKPGNFDTRTQVDRTHIKPIEGFDNAPPHSNLGGCSGGPVFLVNVDGVLHWRLVGVFTESSASYEIIAFNSLQALDSHLKLV